MRGNATLCVVCAGAFYDGSFDPWVSSTNIIYQNGGWRIVTNTWKPHYETGAALCQAAEAGCYICLRVSSLIKDPSAPTSYQMNLRTRETHSERFGKGPIELEGAIGFSVRCAPFHVQGRSGMPSADFGLDEFESDDKAFKLSAESLQETSTASRPCLELARHWFQRCRRDHKSCGKDRDPSWCPSRLLQVDAGSDTIRLIDSASHHPSGPYATLSHCWGTHPIDVLTPFNITQLRAVGRCVQDFPPSFRDCIKTVRSFGISYLWIDSFCILQGDSPESARDWDRESLQMEYVYANSILNIGATFSSDSRGGCFQTRTEVLRSSYQLQWRPMSLRGDCDCAHSGYNDRAMMRWTFNMQPNSDGPFSLQPPVAMLQDSRLYVLSEDGDNENNVMAEFGQHHLFTRAWVAQELLLSVRMLHFGRNQLWWQCTEEPLLCETYPCHMPARKDIIRYHRAVVFRPGALELPPGGLHRLWRLLVSQYTRKNLTKPEKDKLRAIQGIADRVARSTVDRYVEGFFWQQLPKALCWVNMHRDTRRAIPHRAPSWSWASMDGHTLNLLNDDNDPNDQLDPLPQALLVAVVTSLHWVQVNREEQESRQALACIGKTLPLSTSSERSFQHQRIAPMRTACGTTVNFELDDPERDHSNIPSDLCFLPIYERGKIPEPVGLLLADNGDGSFSRIGVTQRYRPCPKPDELMVAYRASKPRLLFLT